MTGDAPPNTPRAIYLLGVVVAITLAILAAGWWVDPPSAGDLVTLLLPLSFLATGAVVTYRLPDNVEAWLLTFTGLAWALALITPFDGSWVVPVCLMTVHLPLRFPSGQLPSSRWRTFSWLAVALTVVLPVVVTTASKVTATNEINNFYVAWTAPLGVLLALLPVCMVASIASLVVRYRRADSTERFQLRWLAWAGTLIVVVYVAALTTSLLYDNLTETESASSNWFVGYPWWLSTLQFTALMSFLLIPLSFAVAILRYRLYDIDRLISRTVTYLLVSGLLIGVYAAVVALAGLLLEGLDNIGVAIATLCAAALIRPLLRRVQRTVDRRFNRSGYDAHVVTRTFAAEVADEVDPTVVVRLLADRVRAAVDPSLLSTWVPERPARP